MRQISRTAVPATHPNFPQLMRLPDVLAWLRCSRSHLYALRKSGRLPANAFIKLGGTTVYDPAIIARAIGLEVRSDG